MLVLAEQNRTFGYAAAASVAVHAFVLLMNLPAMRETPAPPPEPPLVAHIVEAAPPPAPPAPEQKEEKQQKEESLEAKPKPPAVRKRVQKPRPKPVPRKATPIAPPLPAISEQKEEKERAKKQEETALAPPAPSPSLAAIVPPTAAPVPDPTAALARFRQQLVELAVRYKRYPPVARDNGWTGDVVVRVEVAASGEVASIEVKTSSGYEVLDEQALEMFRKAAPAVQVPAALRGKEFAVEVRAIYNLQDRPG